MKNVYGILAIIFLWAAILATPTSIIYFVYDWASDDIAFKSALWGAVKLWMLMLFGGIPLGFTFKHLAKW